MIKRAQLNHTYFRRALIKSPLILIYGVAPLLVGIILSPTFANFVNTPEWLGVFGFSAFIIAVVYLNGLLGALLFGGFLYFFLNAIKMQNRWIYWLVGFGTGSTFNLLYPYYSMALEMAKDLPVVGEPTMAEISLQTFPLFFGLCGLAVAWSFWRELAKGGEINAH